MEDLDRLILLAGLHQDDPVVRVLRIGGNTDNLHPWILPVRAALAYPFADGIFPWKILLRHSVANDCDRGFIGGVTNGEIPAAEDR